MKKILYVGIVALALLFASCATTSTRQPSIYKWSSYTKDTYDYIKSGEEDSIEIVLKTYQWIIDNQTGTVRETVPPGVCADYGYLLVKSGRVQEGKKFLLKEKELYPESAPLVDSVIKMIER